jgi:altronate dehydratase small subunit
MKKAFVIEANDNVATVVVEPISEGESVTTYGRVKDVNVTANQDIPYGHKIAIRDIPKGETIWKYNLSIGNATEDIKAGDHVHVHNIESNRGRGDKATEANKHQVPA